jgi:Predicted nucleoside-diphosphate sugar epimerases
MWICLHTLFLISHSSSSFRNRNFTGEEDKMSLQNNVDSRFEVLKRLFKIAGTPLFSDGETVLYKIYRTMIVFCGYLTLVTTFIGIVKNRNDIDYVMEAARPGFVMINLIWMHFFVR